MESYLILFFNNEFVLIYYNNLKQRNSKLRIAKNDIRNNIFELIFSAKIKIL